jgi:hypothetical protein
MTPRRRKFLSRVALAVTPLWLDPLAWWLAYSSNGVVSLLGNCLAYFELVCVFILLAAIVAVPLCLGGLFFRRHRFPAHLWLVYCVVFTGSFLGGIYLRSEVCNARLHQVIERGQPLIDAIQAYDAKNGQPPPSLNELVPEYIGEIPGTGIGMWPEFHYSTGAPNAFDGNAWVLSVTPPCVGGFDQFFYFPRQNYPDKGYGGGIERIGTWGYVHE